MGLPGADLGLRAEDPTIAELLKPLGYATGQFGKNHLGDKDEFLPSNHGFDEFFGNLYRLNAEEEPELPDYPPAADFPQFGERYGPRGVIHSWADGRIEDTGPLTKQRMETVDEEFLEAATDFIGRQHQAGIPFPEARLEAQVGHRGHRARGAQRRLAQFEQRVCPATEAAVQRLAEGDEGRCSRWCWHAHARQYYYC